MYKIETEGCELISDEIGGAVFEDSITNDELTVKQINMIGGNYILHKILEDGSSFQVGPIVIDQVAIEFIQSLLAKEQEGSVVEQLSEIPEVQEELPIFASPAKYTREYLESVADSSGIQGLREIAEQHDIKAKSVASIISALLSVTE